MISCAKKTCGVALENNTRRRLWDQHIEASILLGPQCIVVHFNKSRYTPFLTTILLDELRVKLDFSAIFFIAALMVSNPRIRPFNRMALGSAEGGF